MSQLGEKYFRKQNKEIKKDSILRDTGLMPGQANLVISPSRQMISQRNSAVGENIVKNSKFNDFTGKIYDETKGCWILGSKYNDEHSYFIGNAYAADLSDYNLDVFDIANVSDFEIDNFTIEFDVIRTHSGDWQNLMVMEQYLTSGFRFGFRNNGQIKFWSDESGGTIDVVSTYILKENVKYHITVTVEKTNGNFVAKLYVNGVFNASDTGTYIIPTGRSARIGCASGLKAGYFLFKGGFHNKVRNSSEIYRMYNGTFQDDSNVIARWVFEDPATWLDDHSTNGNDHSLTTSTVELVHGKANYIGQDWSQGGGILGEEVSTGTLTNEYVYKITATETDHFFTGCEIGDVFCSNGTETCDSNNKVKQISNGNHFTYNGWDNYSDVIAACVGTDSPSYESDSTLDFNGTSQFLDIPDGQDSDFEIGAADDVIIQARIKVSDLSHVNHIINNYDGTQGWQLSVQTDGTVRFYISDGTNNVTINSASGVVIHDTWVHVAVAMDHSANAQIYINAAASGSAIAVSSILAYTDTADLLVGKYSTVYFEGCIDVLSFIKKVLSVDEIEASHGCGKDWVTADTPTPTNENWQQGISAHPSGSANPSITQVISTIDRQLYKFEFDYYGSHDTDIIRVLLYNAGIGGVGISSNANPPTVKTHKEYYFMGDGNDATIYLRHYTNTDGHKLYVDNVKVSVVVNAITPSNFVEDFSLGGVKHRSEISTGTLTNGLLYLITATETNYFGTGLEVDDAFISNGTETCDTNNKVKEISNGNHGLTSGALEDNQPCDPYSWLFDGINDYIDFGNVRDLGTHDGIYCFWIKADDVTSQYFISKYEDANNQFYISTNASDMIRVYGIDASTVVFDYVSQTTLSNDTDQFIAVVIDRDVGIRMFIDCVEVSVTETTAITAADLDNAGDFCIGGYNTSRFDGKLGSVIPIIYDGQGSRPSSLPSNYQNIIRGIYNTICWKFNKEKVSLLK